MTKHYELIGCIPGNTFISKKILRLCASSLSANVCQRITVSIQLSGLGGGNVDNRMVIFIFPTGNERKKLYLALTRGRIHESTIFVGKFLAIILRFLRIEVLPSVLAFYNMLFMNKLEFSSLIDFFE
jgi:hypothetical protein